MRTQRTLRPVALVALVSIAVALVAGFAGPVTAKTTAKAPVQLSGKFNNKGTKTARNDKIAIEVDDYYFEPTFIKATPGSTLTVSLKNEGKMEHTFTVPGQPVDVDLQPDARGTATVTVPADGALVFFCRFHGPNGTDGDLGMQGAVFTKAGQSVENAANAATPTVKAVRNATYGNIIVNADGSTLYQRDSDTATSVTCTGACAGIWPPAIATGTPTAGAGLDQTKLTTVAGPNGNQLVYAGHPLYRFSQDSAPGSVNGEGVAGVWWILGADGQKVTAATTPTTTSPAGK
jgi:predicted lipoprotein with Yx(FWY)xxD motif